VRDEMGKTHKLYLADQITIDGFGELYKPMEERVKQLQNRLVEIQAEVDLLKIDQMLSNASLASNRQSRMVTNCHHPRS
jgi:hypothetical protein